MSEFTKPKVIGFAGYSGSGKTTLIEKLIPALIGCGLKVSLIKHAHHSFDIDQPGKDSYRHREAGAKEVLIASSQRWVLMHELTADPEPTLEQLLAQFEPCDLILVEGYKFSSIPKIEIYREQGNKARLDAKTHNIVAIATDADLKESLLPVLELNNTKTVADFVFNYFAFASRSTP